MSRRVERRALILHSSNSDLAVSNELCVYCDRCSTLDHLSVVKQCQSGHEGIMDDQESCVSEPAATALDHPFGKTISGEDTR